MPVIHGDSRDIFRCFENSIDLIVTSPPYADARKNCYDSVHPDHYVEWFSSFHDPLWNALKPDGSLVINIKDKIVDGVRHRYVWDTIQALSVFGWYCIDDYIWTKPNAMPGFWATRLRDAWEYCFHLAKCKKPFVNHDAVKVPIGDWAKKYTKARPKDIAPKLSDTGSGFARQRSNWIGKEMVAPDNVIVAPLVGRQFDHPAVMPEKIPEFFIKLLSPEGGVVADPFGGSGTVGVAAKRLNREFIIVDNNADYCEVARERINHTEI